jgi:predicted nucleic acid-binding protein
VIAVDTSSFIAYLAHDNGDDTALIKHHLARQEIVLPCVVASELLSNFRMPQDVQDVIAAMPCLPIVEGYWQRAGRLRAGLLAEGYKARLADTLIAQQCLDADVPLITRDGDYARISRVVALRLL